MFAELKKEIQDRIDIGISRDDAVRHVIDTVINTKPINKKVVEEAVHIAAQHTVSQAFTEHRRSICDRADRIGRLREEGTKNLKEKVAGLMEFRLPNGLTLSEATGSECTDAANYYMHSSRTQYHRASFLYGVASAVGDSYVKDVLKEEDLQNSYEKARRLP